jgi:hypothetical protein
VPALQICLVHTQLLQFQALSCPNCGLPSCPIYEMCFLPLCYCVTAFINGDRHCTPQDFHSLETYPARPGTQTPYELWESSFVQDPWDDYLHYISNIKWDLEACSRQLPYHRIVLQTSDTSMWVSLKWRGRGTTMPCCWHSTQTSTQQAH